MLGGLRLTVADRSEERKARREKAHAEIFRAIDRISDANGLMPSEVVTIVATFVARYATALMLEVDRAADQDQGGSS